MRPVTVTLAAGVLVLAACGSQGRVRVVPPPRLPRSVAASLASRSDAVASALRRGDACGAKSQMHELEHQTQLAIASGGVPVVYRPRLLTAVTQLAARMPLCAPPPPPPPPKPKPKDKHHKHDKHPGKGGEGD